MAMSVGPLAGAGRVAPLFRQRPGVVSQAVEGEAVLLDISSGKYFALNPVGSRIWELCDGTRSTDEVVAAICAVFEVDEEVARADLAEILDELRAEQLLVEA